MVVVIDLGIWDWMGVQIVWISSQALVVLICMRWVGECLFSNLLSECFQVLCHDGLD